MTHNLTPGEPTRPDEGTVLRAERDGFACACRMPFDDVEMPAEFDGPDDP